MRTVRNLLLVSLLVFVVGIVWAQIPLVDVPPEVLAVQPFPGEEMPLDMPLTVVFNQPMNQASVETAWSFTPQVAGTFQWTEPRTVVFTPSDGWSRDAIYEVRIAPSALSVDELALEETYRATIRTVGHLLVNSVIPSENATGVAADATITVAFNRPVVPLGSTEDLSSLPNPLRIEPSVQGHGEWLNTSIYQFIPEESLLGGASYTVTVQSGLTDFSGAALENDYRWSFETLSPEILSTSPTSSSVIPLDYSFSIQFSQPMNQEATTSAFRLIHETSGLPVPGAKSWSGDGTRLTFMPDERLSINTSYRMILDATVATGVGGAKVREGRDFSFRTVPLPYIEYVYPADGDLASPGHNSVSIQFGTAMNTDFFADKVLISPQPETVAPYVYGNRNLDMQFAFQPNSSYTVTVLAGAEDIYGNRIESDYTVQFSVGDIEPYIYIPDTRNFIVTGGYRENTVLSVNVAGQPEVDFTLYRVPQEFSAGIIQQYLYDDVLNPLLTISEPVRQWRETFGDVAAYSNVKVNLASAEGGVLPLGSYVVIAEYQENDRPVRLPVSLGVVNSNLTVKRTEEEVLVWVTDMVTGEPLPDQNVTVYNLYTIITQGVTDAQGVLRLKMDFPSSITISSSDDAHFGLWRAYNEPTSQKTDVYFYTDRPLYRPGETLYFRGAYRERDDFNYQVSNLRNLDVVVSDFQGTTLLEAPLALTEFGTFSGELLLPEDVAVGSLYFTLNQNGNYLGQFFADVAEFRVPEFSVEVTADQDEILASENIRAVVTGKFFSGGTVSDANVTWTADAVQTAFNYTGPGRYTFSDVGGGVYLYEYDYYGGYGYSSRSVGYGDAVTDSSGNLVLELTETTPLGPYPENITIEATMNDESGQYISGRTSVLVHPSEVYVGVRTDRYFGQEGTPFAAEIITVSTESEAVSGQPVDLTLIERRWEREEIEGQFGRYNWTQREIEVETVRIMTDENGTARHEFTPPNAGIYVVKAHTMDRLERVHESSLSLWVTGNTRVWWGQPTNTIDLIADQDSYVTGDTAQILVPVSLEGESWVLVSIERDGIISYEVVRVEGSTLVYELPILESYEPGIYLSVMIMHGVDEANNVPTFRRGSIQLPVEPVSKQLDVSITPSSMNAQPGETVTLDIQATDAAGNPVQAEFGLALVDAAILSLKGPNSIDPLTHYYQVGSNYTYTDTMLTALVDGRLDETFGEEKNLPRDEAEADGAFANGRLASTAVAEQAAFAGDFDDASGVGYGGGAPPSPFEQVEVREDFQQTPLWEAHIVTDANGQAQVSVTMPDNLTIWNLTARALTKDTQVAETTLDIASTLPLLVRPATPRFFVVGDEVTLAMVINNNSDEVQDILATMQGSGYELIDGTVLEQSIAIEPNSRERLEWQVKILDVDSVDVTFVAVGNDGYQDASKPPLATGPDGTIPVYRYTAPDTTGTGGVLREGGSRTEGISIPPFADTDQGTLTVQLDPSLAVTTIDSLDYLKNYPHQCVEQTVSRFLPNVMTYRALQSLGIQDVELEADLQSAVDFGMERLKSGQNADGGWGWFVSMESNPLVTAYALFGLIEARNSSYPVDLEMIDRGVAFLRTQFIQPTEDTDPYQLNRQAFYFYVLTRAVDGRYTPAISDMDALFHVRLEMSHYAKAFLLMAYANSGNVADEQINALTSDLITAAKLSATGAHWEEEFRDWWNWGSDTRSTAIVLSALIEAIPDSELLPNAVRWLMIARQGDHWQTTQETAWAVMAFTDWMVETQELSASYEYTMLLNGDEQANASVTPDTVRDGQRIVINVADLLRDEINRLTLVRGDGEGALYYTAHLRLRLDASEVSATNRGVGITREYFVDGQEKSVTEAQMGDILTVRLTVTLPETIYYFVLEDPLPAGVEAVDTSLLTTSQSVPGTQLRPAYNPYYYWYWWYWDHTEIRDESVNLYADVLPPGTYVYSYQVRATTPGKFQTMPSHGYAFYFPEVFGRSDGELFTVHNTE